MKKAGLFLIAFLCMGSVFHSCFAQNDSATKIVPPKLLIGFSVPHTALHGLKLEVLVPVANKLYLSISPEFYSGKLTYSDEGQLSGIGLHPGLRYAYWQNERKGKGIIAFAQGDVEYNFFAINKRDKRWVERDQNGQKVMVLEEDDVFKRYHRFGMNYKMGGLWYFPSGFYYEWSFGVAIRKTVASFSDNYFPDIKNDDFPWSYGYSGVAPIFGFRIGFLIR
ncbi:MAG TPA: hypothetical protein DIW47_07500 [Bacteroidetes bacterium]|nr:hypothetical protein [Bacteroidota bacterium]